TQLDQETQDYINQLLEAEQQKVVAMQTQLDTLQQSQQTKENELQELQTKLYNQKVEQSLKEANLLQFKDIVNASTEDELNEVIEKLSTAVSSTTQDFHPTGKRNTS